MIPEINLIFSFTGIHFFNFNSEAIYGGGEDYYFLKKTFNDYLKVAVKSSNIRSHAPLKYVISSCRK